MQSCIISGNQFLQIYYFNHKCSCILSISGFIYFIGTLFSCFTNISTGIYIKCLILSQHEEGKYHSLPYKIEIAKVIVSHDPIFTEKKYIF